MPTLQDLRHRRHSIQSSQKMTSAMKMVAAAKLRQFQKQWENASGHLNFLEKALGQAAYALDPADFPLMARGWPHPRRNILWIVIGADRGLCGAFNSQIARFFRGCHAEAPTKHQFHLAIAVGERMISFLEKEGMPLKHKEPMGKRPMFAQAASIADVACDFFNEGQIDACFLVYTRFVSALRQEVVKFPLLPFALEPVITSTSQRTQNLLEPSPEILCESLCRFTIQGVVYKALVESCVSEQGARMAAMENATRNGEDILKNLDLAYNRRRQTLITNELIEVISGANAS